MPCVSPHQTHWKQKDTNDQTQRSDRHPDQNPDNPRALYAHHEPTPTLISRITELVHACFTGLYVETREPQ